MDHEEIDAKRIIEKIRLNLRPRIDARSPSAAAPLSPPLPPSSATGDDPVAYGLKLLQGAVDVYHTTFKSHRKVVGPVVVFAKKLVLRLLKPVLERQVAYNAANIHVLEALRNEVESATRTHAASTAQFEHRASDLEQDVARFQTGLEPHVARLRGLDDRTVALEQDVARLQTGLEPHVARLRGLDDRTATLEQRVASVEASLNRQPDAARERIAGIERKLRRLLHSLNAMGHEGERPTSGPDSPSAIEQSVIEPEFDYAGFEERFRGAEADIKEHQARYLEHLRGSEPVLDLGCGRGELLELLLEAGVEARGVDLNLDMVLLCQEKGLDVVHDDAFSYLRKIPDSSLGGIFSSQFIEHFPPKQIIAFTQACYRKLRPGGVLIFETINPGCLTVFARSFFLDPSHVWPFHPEMLRFLFETTGFADVRLDFFSPVEPCVKLPYFDRTTPGVDAALLNRCIDTLNDLLFGFQDFAIVGRKSLVRSFAR